MAGKLTQLLALLAKSLPPIVWFTIKLWRWKGAGYAMIPHIYLLLAYDVAQRVFPKNIGELWRGKVGGGEKMNEGQCCARWQCWCSSVGCN